MWQICFYVFEIILRFFRQLFHFLSSTVSSVLSLFSFSSSSSSVIYFPNGNVKVTLLHTIGEGAYSFVYIAEGQHIQQRGGTLSLQQQGQGQVQKYAVKKMFLQSKDLESCAMTEVESLQRFQHPNILKLISYVKRDEGRAGGGGGGGGQGGGQQVMYMLFPLIENGSLRNVLNRRERQVSMKPKLREVLTDFTAVCEALNVLHSFQPSYVHQDIKPEVSSLSLSLLPP
jgi:serine/threonine protein kinase